MIDVNKDQRRAANPLTSVWVAASAGSGKTKVLTDRVLNLLLMNGRPDKLLCLTFTKAAAAEMSNRIGKILKRWATCSDADLVKGLESLTGETPTEETLIRARRLFAKVLETPGGMKIMTIHSFCQSILKRFPLEAGVSPNFNVIDEDKSQTLLNQTLEEVLVNPDFQPDIRQLSRYKTQDDLIILLQDLFSHRLQLMELVNRFDFNGLIEQIKICLHVAQYKTESEIISAAFDLNDWPTIKEAFLKKDGSVQKRKENDPTGELAADTEEKIRHFKIIQITKSLLHLAYAVLEKYQIQKQNAGLLDYEDLIATTKKLLTRQQAAAWVLYKLDGGIDHILVDEAQDTNPDQWTIIRAIAEEFFSGEDQHDTIRTIFAVGDKKQSIYGFQGADPDEFERMRLFFEHKIKGAENDFATIPFNLSFRSTKPVLDLVNYLLQNPDARAGVVEADEDVTHLPYREQDAGLVEIWPLEDYRETDDPAPWKPPVERIQNQSALSRLAEKIADKIQSLIQKQELLESQGRPIQPGDFLILVQRRNQFVSELVRYLKERNIPVAGIDRLNLSQHIAIQDLMAAAKFALLPEDDLNLACLLKSPFINLTEDELFQAAHNRQEQSLWTRIQNLYPPKADLLKQILNQSDKIPPYEFFSFILGPMGGRRAFLARLGQEANEALDEFLNLALNFEQNNTPSLQNFIDQMANRTLEIKRDMETGQNAVRIMTVHGSKGLQGNIVFLPQTRYIARKRESFLWLNQKLPLWIPAKEMQSPTLSELIQRVDSRSDEENKRLLYVAVTRASDRLYICGYDGGKTVQDDNWYDLICRSVKHIKPDSDGIIRIKSQQNRPVTKAATEPNHPVSPLPNWAKQPAPIETVPPTPLSPSKPETEDVISDSPLSEGQAAALERGKFIHQLLQYLPNIPTDRWEIVIRRLKPPHIDLPNYIFQLLESNQFRDIFGPNSLAEVPIVGVWRDKVVSGQIDRLVIRENDVWIVDFKTNRHVPTTPADVPVLYRNQLAAYRGLISQIFSGKVVRTYLLWTETLTLMEIPNEN
ncbi:MAG: double-strand break repair helicase AddA [Alphaproteobacteria bacterium]|nr:double-strand break repair helicase AddA [Alphaproteobacteria bacterium]